MSDLKSYQVLSNKTICRYIFGRNQNKKYRQKVLQTHLVARHFEALLLPRRARLKPI